MGVNPKIGVKPQNGWFIMENPMNKWMIWGAHPYFWKHPYIPWLGSRSLERSRDPWEFQFLQHWHSEKTPDFGQPKHYYNLLKCVCAGGSNMGEIVNVLLLAHCGWIYSFGCRYFVGLLFFLWCYSLFFVSKSVSCFALRETSWYFVELHVPSCFLIHSEVKGGWLGLF